MELQRQVSLSQLCTLGIGGPARFYTLVRSTEALQEVLAWASIKKIPFFILGKGSNCLFEDKGFDGLVIHNKINTIEDLGSGRWSVGAGYSFALLGVQTARQGWSGLEFASGIPASVGGALYMNAGAQGQETSTYLESVVFITDDGVKKSYPRHELTFGYRQSAFHQMRGAIASAIFALHPEPSSRKKQLQLIEYRQKTQPYSDKSAGCVFQNPSPVLSAGQLIEQCGLKGHRVGDAQVSCLHANFLINCGHATAKDFLELTQQVEQTVFTKTGIRLTRELQVIDALR